MIKTLLLSLLLFIILLFSVQAETTSYLNCTIDLALQDTEGKIQYILNATLDACYRDQGCLASFAPTLHGDVVTSKSLEYVLRRCLQEEGPLQESMFSNTSAVCSANTMVYWLSVLQARNPCMENQAFIIGRGCTCIQGKTCIKNERVRANASDIVTNVCAALLLSAIVLIGSKTLKLLHQIKRSQAMNATPKTEVSIQAEAVAPWKSHERAPEPRSMSLFFESDHSLKSTLARKR